MTSTEDQARENIDRMLASAGWAIFNQNDANFSAGKGVAIRNFTFGLDPDPRSRPVFSFHKPETLAKWLVPVAPPNEQKRIVAEIKKQFSRLDELREGAMSFAKASDRVSL